MDLEQREKRTTFAKMFSSLRIAWGERD